MTHTEFSDQFDVLYNNITSNQAPGLNEYEKSVFLTKAQNELVKNYFSANSKGNNLGQGYDDSAKRRADFSCLMKTATCNQVYNLNRKSVYSFTYNNFSPIVTLDGSNSIYAVNKANEIKIDPSSNPVPTGGKYVVSGVDYNENRIAVNAMGITLWIYGMLDKINYTTQGLQDNTISISVKQVDASEESLNKIDPRSTVYEFPDDVFIVINESINTARTIGRILQVVPLHYDDYLRLMSKPFKRPLKNQAWRLNSSGIASTTGISKYVEIITNSRDNIYSYTVRYIRRPKPIILGSLDDLTIEGKNDVCECELDPVLHEEILQRAVELAKASWTATGQDNVQIAMTTGQRSE